MTTDPILVRTEDPAEPPTPPTGLSRGRWLVVIIGLIVVIAGVFIVTTQLPRWLTATDVRPPGATSGTGADSARRIQATLYYVSTDGTQLVGMSRSVAYGETTADQARRLIEAQIAPPPEGLVSAIPTGTTVRAVFVTDTHDAYVDLGGAIVSGHTGGSLDEALTVYTIVNAITVNLPDITGVQILVDGKEVDSLTGHLDLRAPLAKALDWVEKGQ